MPRSSRRLRPMTPPAGNAMPLNVTGWTSPARPARRATCQEFRRSPTWSSPTIGLPCTRQATRCPPSFRAASQTLLELGGLPNLSPFTEKFRQGTHIAQSLGMFRSVSPFVDGHGSPEILFRAGKIALGSQAMCENRRRDRDARMILPHRLLENRDRLGNEAHRFVQDRKSTRLNSSHLGNTYVGF